MGSCVCMHVFGYVWVLVFYACMCACVCARVYVWACTKYEAVVHVLVWAHFNEHCSVLLPEVISRTTHSSESLEVVGTSMLMLCFLKLLILASQ